MNDGDDLDKIETSELARRLMADIDELAVEFELEMTDIGGKLNVVKDQLHIEAMGMTPKHFGDDVLIKLEDALYLPILGGETLRNDQRTASRTFTKASLELAIKKGHLIATWKNNKLHVTVGAVKSWASMSEKERKQTADRPRCETPEVKSNRQRQQATASHTAVRERLAALKLAHKKGKR